MAAKTDSIAARFDLIPLRCLERTAKTFEHGALKYGQSNWMSGDHEFSVDRLNHAIAHIKKAQAGYRDEDHLAHAIADLMISMEIDRDRSGIEFGGVVLLAED